jgi:hypothetical protein
MVNNTGLASDMLVRPYILREFQHSKNASPSIRDGTREKIV